ncbi:hypothetical protein ACN47E_005704 [Coniothyrium glycines]
MSLKNLSLLALASIVSAQTTPDLAGALSGSSDLSALNGVLAASPELLQSLGGLTNITVLAPSNAAFAAVDNATLAGLTANPGLLAAVLQYHVLNGTYPSSAITNQSAFVPTSLTNTQFTNVTGGQRVEVINEGGNVTIYSGLLANSSVTQADVNFTGGVIHVVDRLLTLPEDAASTLLAANLTSLRGALVNATLVDTVNNTPNLTIFAPTNEAFRNIGSALPNLTAEQITDVLTYHVVAQGPSIGYSSTLSNGSTLTTVNGEELTIIVGESGIFVNNAKVVIADVLIANGVVHVIDNVLNPTNQTLAAGTEEQGVAAYEGATPASDYPFTSGQPTASTTIAPQATSAANPTAGSSTSTAGAAPMQTGAVGLGALFGAAAVYFM